MHPQSLPRIQRQHLKHFRMKLTVELHVGPSLLARLHLLPRVVLLDGVVPISLSFGIFPILRSIDLLTEGFGELPLLLQPNLIFVRRFLLSTILNKIFPIGL